jgi:phosphoribosylaminoimidazole-succinocarboxamide synthase
VKGYDAYTSGTSKEKPKNLSKEFLRQWLIDQDFDGTGKLPEMSDEFVQQISDRYIELYESVTGQTFKKADTGDIAHRIESNVLHYIEGNLA